METHKKDFLTAEFKNKVKPGSNGKHHTHTRSLLDDDVTRPQVKKQKASFDDLGVGSKPRIVFNDEDPPSKRKKGVGPKRRSTQKPIVKKEPPVHSLTDKGIGGDGSKEAMHETLSALTEEAGAKPQQFLRCWQAPLDRFADKIDLIDRVLMPYFHEWCHSENEKTEYNRKVIDGLKYTYVNLQTILDQLPELGLGMEALKKRIAKLVKAGILKKKTLPANSRHRGSRSYFRVSDEVESVVTSIEEAIKKEIERRKRDEIDD